MRRVLGPGSGRGGSGPALTALLPESHRGSIRVKIRGEPAGSVGSARTAGREGHLCTLSGPPRPHGPGAPRLCPHGRGPRPGPGRSLRHAPNSKNETGGVGFPEFGGEAVQRSVGAQRRAGLAIGTIWVSHLRILTCVLTSWPTDGPGTAAPGDVSSRPPKSRLRRRKPETPTGTSVICLPREREFKRRQGVLGSAMSIAGDPGQVGLPLPGTRAPASATSCLNEPGSEACQGWWLPLGRKDE